MKIKHWTHNRVKPDGVVLDENGFHCGAVGVVPSISMSSDDGGCGLEGCHCSDGHWLVIGFGRNEKDETVSGVTVYFDNYDEMQTFLSERELK